MLIAICIAEVGRKYRGRQSGPAPVEFLGNMKVAWCVNDDASDDVATCRDHDRL